MREHGLKENRNFIYKIESIKNMDSIVPIKKYVEDNDVSKVIDLEEE